MNSNSIAATQLFDCVWPVWPPCILKMSYEMDIHQPTQSSLMTNHVIVSIRAMGVEALRRCYNDAAVREKVSHGDDCIMVLSAFSHHHITPLCHLQDSLTGPDHFGCTCTPRPFSWTTMIIQGTVGEWLLATDWNQQNGLAYEQCLWFEHIWAEIWSAVSLLGMLQAQYQASPRRSSPFRSTPWGGYVQSARPATEATSTAYGVNGRILSPAEILSTFGK